MTPSFHFRISQYGVWRHCQALIQWNADESNSGFLFSQVQVGALGVVILLLSIPQIFTSMKDIAHRALLSNSIDETELKTGKRTEGIVFSMQNFVSKLIAAVPRFIQGYTLKFPGFDQNIKTAPNQTVYYPAEIK